MPKKVYDESNIAAIAQRIRERTGGNEVYDTSEMPSGIDRVFEAGENVYGQILADMIAGTLAKLVLPDYSRVIGYQAFYGKYYNIITFGEELETIKDLAFESSGTPVYDFSKCKRVPILESENAFNDTNISMVMMIPDALYDEWSCATNWSSFADWNMKRTFASVTDAPVIPDRASEGLDIRDGVFYGRGTCTDSVIVLPEDCYKIASDDATGVLYNDKTVDTLVLSPKGTIINCPVGTDSSLRAIINYKKSDYSFALYNTNLLEYISFLDGAEIVNYDFRFSMWRNSFTYDFSACKSLPILQESTYFYMDGDYKIYTPVDLYNEWSYATNWTNVYWNNTAAFIPVARKE